MRPSHNPQPNLVIAPRTIVGYHGCDRAAAEHILAEGQFLVSTNTYDWLGEGAYFWEYAPYRALEWAQERHRAPAVLAATVRLGRCLNLLDREHFAALAKVYDRVAQRMPAGKLPRNTAAGAHYLDRYVIDSCCRFIGRTTARPFQTVRGCFPEGDPIYKGSKLLTKAHTQIAVRDLTCISGVRLVHFP